MLQPYVVAAFQITQKSNSKIKFETQITSTDAQPKHLKQLNIDLPTVGLLMYNGVLQSEVIATSDVFAKPTEDGKQLFNVITS